MIPNYNHPARTAECIATLDIISDGRVDFGIGDGATRLELGASRDDGRLWLTGVCASVALAFAR